ncbi:hypothetical protein GTQ99_00320 [Kineococcus sp. T13]|uniref:hypothetical protein n=1 Tax=Kineococcus vitellinus TaxID=2696565 RepID=UPI0014133450|nr:hypothetical protein [Kineococcus vitellinus]NAZ73875.1 hypothetical protein [Kineococcus vitellinus]
MPIAHVGHRDLSQYGKLKYAPPALVDPVTITLSSTNRAPRLDPTRDYILRCPAPVAASGGVVIDGGRNVVAIGGGVDLGSVYSATNGNRGLFIKGNASGAVPRTVHVEGWALSGYLTEGINIDTLGDPQTRVVLQNMVVGEVKGSFGSNHADVIQTWRGPYELYTDRVYGQTTYQGIFADPHKFDPVALGTWRLSRMYLKGSSESGALLWITEGAADGSDRPMIVTDDVWLKPNPAKQYPGQVVYAKAAYWGTGVKRCPGGKRSPVSSNPGPHYVSPGYLA